MHHHNHGNGFLDILLYILLIVLIVGYLVLVYRTNEKYKKWPMIRCVFWIIGIAAVFLGIAGPIAERAHASFQAHMMTHLLLGMLGPLLLVLSAPMSLLLRSVPVTWGRILSKVLKSFYVRWITHPIIASILNAGGLWILYTTDLYHSMQSSNLLHVFVHVHVFLAGYVFTLSMIYIEVTPHRTSFQLRAIVLILAMAAHSILSKWIYANPPLGVEATDAQLGGMLMYYGGDAIDLVIVILLCAQYFKGKKRAVEGRVYTVAKTSEG
ncbi:cytochrome c oxidase assembly protein [Ureibacillus chungkukjangi]|uniref:cytochrome c oxidase assembly protein n=1 Tax=Ureibacillus chungkukjangi TaxID=1202712 RepID=UPI00203D8065|nr:cytochrome c oxidase assembly protein [Ureibacillus chungkukjangi]MCM3389499.1 cytochrome c oxidase assembly protein [Ureibacillus chungkukjangi]